MTTLTLHISDSSILPSLKKVLGAMDGVTVVPARKRKTEMQKAMK